MGDRLELIDQHVRPISSLSKEEADKVLGEFAGLLMFSKFYKKNKAYFEYNMPEWLKEEIDGTNIDGAGI